MYETLGNEIFGIRREHSTLTPSSRDVQVEYFRNYPEYLQTNHWRTLRGQTLQRFGFRCAMCNRNVRLDVHHRTYERLGAELPEDLIALCQPCHSKHHGVLPRWNP